MNQTYKIMSVTADGKSLPPTELFDAWVVMARDLADALPDSWSKKLCSAVYDAVSSDRAFKLAEGG